MATEPIDSVVAQALLRAAARPRELARSTNFVQGFRSAHGKMPSCVRTSHASMRPPLRTRLRQGSSATCLPQGGTLTLR